LVFGISKFLLRSGTEVGESGGGEGDDRRVYPVAEAGGVEEILSALRRK